ncbi:hypothetical protein GCM10022254_66790 [Actinomadura meridiana]|uniref:Peptidase S8/S53 domain-containing protein n=1 Tax=Actinomadura meridiana TaxID=559626 RepID=A0ABP8CM02_9ACTN
MAGAVAAVALAGTWLIPVPARADIVRDRQQPILNVLGVKAAWGITKGKGVTVAVVDSGVDAGQPDLAGSVTTGPNMLADVDAGTKPARLHGTGMASLIAGHGHGAGNRDGVIGIAPEARILAVRAIGEPEDKSYARYRTSQNADTAVARGIRYAADHGADVINLSLGKDEEVAEEREAIGYAIGKGVVVVSAVGNDGDDQRVLDGDGYAPYSYPASYPGVIAVAATEPGHARAPFSNRNYSVLLSAPGVDIPVAGPGDEYFSSAGTSDSSALVSGIAALIRAKHPKMAPALVAQSLLQSVRHTPSGGYNAEIGFGEVHAPRALSAADALAAGGSGGKPGKAAGQRFGKDDPGPVEVIDRPGWVTPLIVGIVVAGIVGTAMAVMIAMTFRRRHPRLAGGPQVGLMGPMPMGPPMGGQRPGPPQPAGQMGPPLYGPPRQQGPPPPGRPLGQQPPPGAPGQQPSFRPPDPQGPPPGSPQGPPPGAQGAPPSFRPPEPQDAPFGAPQGPPPAPQGPPQGAPPGAQGAPPSFGPPEPQGAPPGAQGAPPVFQPPEPEGAPSGAQGAPPSFGPPEPQGAPPATSFDSQDAPSDSQGESPSFGPPEEQDGSSSGWAPPGGTS